VVALVLYIIGGIVYNRLVLRKQGFDQLPRISIFSFTDTLDALSNLCDRMLGSRTRSWQGNSYAHRTAFRDEEAPFGRDGETEEEHDQTPDVPSAHNTHNSNVPAAGMDSNGVIRL
jgi:cation-dependent mannose-6-phosphate receptor